MDSQMSKSVSMNNGLNKADYYDSIVFIMITERSSGIQG